ncbi:MAG: type IV pilus assembly protein PilM [Deltaproteobacteria bacterium]|nr:type IV pilus assembly protein PilM [Deltaproteobacteria bacterium]
MYSFQLTKNYLGIDIGTHSLKIAECQRAGEKVTLLNYEIVPLPDGLWTDQALYSQELSLLIRNTLKRMGVRSSDIISEIAGPWTVARHMVMTDLADDEMREAIRWGSKADFPFSLEEAIIDFHKLKVVKQEEGETEAEIIFAAATREVIEERVALLKGAGLKPLFISNPPFSLMQTYRITQPAPWSETAVVIDLGHTSTQIIVLNEGELKFSREIAVAGDAFTQSMIGVYEKDGERSEIDEENAENVKIKIGLLEEVEADPVLEGILVDQVQKRLRSVMDRLLLEVERSLNYYKSEFKDYEINRILVTGGGGLLKGLPEALEKNLDIPVHFFKTPGSLTLKKKINEDLFSRNIPFLTTLLGLVTQRQPYINLSSQFSVLPAKKISFDKFLKPALAGVLPLAVVLFFGSQYWTASQQVTRLRKEINAKTKQMAQMGKPGEELARLEKEEARLNKELEGFPKIEIRKLPLNNLFQELTRLVPGNMTLTRFEFSRTQETRTGPENGTGLPKSPTAEANAAPVQSGISIGKEKREYPLTVQGLVFGSDQEIIATLSGFVQVLNRSPFFKEAKVQTSLKSNQYSRGAAEFKIQAKLGEGPGRSLGVSF